MAQTKVTGREVSDKSIFDADIDLTTAVMHPVLVSSDRLLLVDPVDGNIKTCTYANLLTALDTRYSLTTHMHNYEPVITTGTTSQYWRGDKSWQTLPDLGSISASDTQILFMNGTAISGNAGLTFDFQHGNFSAGYGAHIGGTNNCVVGSNSIAGGSNSTAIGFGVEAGGIGTIVIGGSSQSFDDYAIIIGTNSYTYGANAIVIGRGAIAINDNDIEIGSASYFNKTSIYGDILFPTIVMNGFLKIADGQVYVDSGGSGSGTVTSVGLSLPNIFSVSGSPVTVSGTLSATFVSQAKNYVFAAPSSDAGVPGFRKLAESDIPALGYDNYYSWTMGVNAGSYNIFGTQYGSGYSGIKLVAGAGVTLNEASSGTLLQVTINSSAVFSGLQNTVLGRSDSGYGIYSEMNPASIRRILCSDVLSDRLIFLNANSSYSRRDTWVTTGASNVNYTGQTLTDITGLTIILGSYTTYEFEAILSVQTSAVTTGCQYAIAYTTTSSQFSGQIIGSINTSYAKSSMLALSTASGSFLTTSGQTGQILIKGIIKTIAGGFLSVKHLKVTSGTSTILPYSYFKVTEI